MSRHMTFGVFVAAGLAAAALLVVLLAPRASDEPDGLDKVAIDEGFAEAEADHALDDTPTAGYTIDDSESPWGTVAAGLVGVTVTFVLAGGLFLLVRQRPSDGPRSAGTPPPAGTPPA
jgi:cobalt/nickel transport system permease protein